MLTAQGYGVIIPEMLGYGGTDKPTEASAYSRVLVADSVAGILAAENIDKVIVLGHDWVCVNSTLIQVVLMAIRVILFRAQLWPHDLLRNIAN